MTKLFTWLILGILVFTACTANEHKDAENQGQSPIKKPTQALLHLSKDSPLPLLPDLFLDTWKKVGPSQRFTGADLYGHINGGAEVFLELGFENLEVQRYSAVDNQACLVDVEIYWMSDPPAATGVYLLHCGKEERIEMFAPRHTANRYQIQFFAGNAYVKINNPKAMKDAGKALPDFARHVAKQLPEQQEFLPESSEELFSTLPTEARIERSERIIRGPFTLERISLLGKGDLLLLEKKITAHAADYRDINNDTFSRIVAVYAGAGEARAAFEHFCAHLDPNIKRLTQESDSLVFKDYSDRFGAIELHDKKVELTVNRGSNPWEQDAPR